VLLLDLAFELVSEVLDEVLLSVRDADITAEFAAE
jgi:hypothetical protein